MPYADSKKRAEAQKKYREKKKQQDGPQSKRWLFVFYPDSVPGDWNRIIGEWQCECLVSPLHDRDVNPDGTLKKPHWHGIIRFEKALNAREAMEFISELRGPIPMIPAGSTRSCARYLVHLDNPEKFQYDKTDVLEFGGWSWSEACMNEDETLSIIGEMMDWCDETGCVSFAVLLKFARLHKPEWFRALCKNSTYVMKEYLKSQRYDRMDSERVR